MTNPFEHDPRYLDVLEVMQLGGEGGSETLYRVLPKGEANFIWYAVGSGRFDDELFDEDCYILGDYEDIGEYLLQKLPHLASYYLEHADPAFSDQIFSGFITSLREMSRQPAFQNPISNILCDSPAGSWCAWQKHLHLVTAYEKLVIHSALVESPVLELTLDREVLSSGQQLLDTLYMTLAHLFAPPGSYGSRWQLYDLIGCRQIHFPRDDRLDSLRDAGISLGGRWVIYGLA